MTETQTISGSIENKMTTEGESHKGKWKRTVFTVAGIKASTFDENLFKYKEGDSVTMTYLVQGGFNNITNIVPQDSPTEEQITEDFMKAAGVPSQPTSQFEGVGRTQELIVRQTALKCASEITKEITPTNTTRDFVKDQTIELAESFAAWILKK